jgi:hypothetical protein
MASGRLVLIVFEVPLKVDKLQWLIVCIVGYVVEEPAASCCTCASTENQGLWSCEGQSTLCSMFLKVSNSSIQA